MNQHPASIIYNPIEVSKLGTDYLAFRRDHRDLALQFPVKKMREKVYPLAAGEVMSIIARPGHMKTGLMMYWARQRANLLKAFDNRVTIYATWEQSIEELHSFYIAAEQQLSITKMAKGDLDEDDFKKVMNASASRISEPLFFVGHSMMRKTGRMPITTVNLAEAIEKVQEDGFEVDSVFVDYLQQIPPLNIRDGMVTAFSETMRELKNIALGLGIPLVAGVQASRDVEKTAETNTKMKTLPIPEMHHAQWTSNIEQSSDRVLSLVRLRRYRKPGEFFGSHLVEGNNQLLITMLKQKLGEGNFAELVSFNPVFNKLNENEEKYGGVDDERVSV
jgi:replicative DNA helicase